jgi:hypothetical protein
MRIILTLIAVLFVGAGATWYTVTSEDGQDLENVATSTQRAPDTTAVAAQETQAARTAISGTDLTKIFATHDTVHCEYKSVAQGTTHTGTLWYAKGHNAYRIIDRLRQSDKTYTTNTLVDGSTVYTWGRTLSGTVAYTMPLPEDAVPEQVLTGSIEPPAHSDTSTVRDVQLECFAESIPPGKLQKPEGVEFQSMAETMPTRAM